MAVAIMRDIIRKDPILSQRKIEICSAGTGAIGGQEAHPYAQETMKGWGLPLDDHVSSTLSRDIVDRADLIVALDNHVKEEIIGSYPASLKKIYTLNIADPYRFLLEAYQRCAQDIRDKCISKVLPLVSLLHQPD
jgi:protein-tyrosine phosphatase